MSNQIIRKWDTDKNFREKVKIICKLHNGIWERDDDSDDESDDEHEFDFTIPEYLLEKEKEWTLVENNVKDSNNDDLNSCILS